MFYKACITFCLAVTIVHLSAQLPLYTPRNVAKAYQKKTRQIDGKPGKNYWQNHGVYDIKINVSPPCRKIEGKETICYTNNSPDTIATLVIKLILNIHKLGAQRYSDVSEDYLNKGIQIDEVAVDGKKINWKEPAQHCTWQTLFLPNRLLPQGSVKLTFQWHYDVSLESNREGMLDSTSFFLAYFYPRVAVYDDCNGWDRMNFTDAQEFYNDYNDYTLSVTAPQNFIVWSTGTLQNANDVLMPTYFERLNKSMATDEIIHITDQKDIDFKNITAQKNTNTWIWKVENITDISCAISDHYIWDATSIVVNKTTQHRISVQAAYKNEATDFHYMTQWGKHALNWLSTQWPGVAYPFPKITIIQGFAGMEYPMMVNSCSIPDTSFSRIIIEHEIAHSWFPFYMGINEHRYGFMDEGWATTFEYLIGVADMGKEREEILYKNFRVGDWISDPSAEEDLPIITPANTLNDVALNSNEYGKASLGYLAIKDLLGNNLFRKCLHTFIERWHGKHPTPWDFFYTFNNISGKDLNWFWNSWFFSFGYIDIAIENVKPSNNGYTLLIKNIGGFPAPTDVLITYIDNSKEVWHQTPNIWQNTSVSNINIHTKKKIKTIVLDGGIFMDADTSNNRCTL